MVRRRSVWGGHDEFCSRVGWSWRVDTIVQNGYLLSFYCYQRQDGSALVSIPPDSPSEVPESVTLRLFTSVNAIEYAEHQRRAAWYVPTIRKVFKLMVA